MSGEGPGLARSAEEIEAARVLARAGFAAQAVSRAYFAAFYAAEAALLALGEVRSKHAGVIAAFGRRVVKEDGVDPADARLLRSLFERNNQADYALDPVPAAEADAAIDDADRFVAAVRAWLARRPAV